jgi:hypothetical protein
VSVLNNRFFSRTKNEGHEAPIERSSGASRVDLPDHRQLRLFAWIVVLITALASIAALFGELVWDDWELVAYNRFVQGHDAPWGAAFEPLFNETPPEEPQTAFYRPIVSLSLALIGQMVGTRPIIFHTLSLILHLLVVRLVFAWLETRLYTIDRHRWRPLVLIIASLYFSLHPTRALAVAWISGVGDLWMAVFALSAALLMEAETQKKKNFCLVCLFSACAVWSKEAGAVVLLWLVVDIGLRRGMKTLIQRIPVLLSAFIGTAVALGVRSAIIDSTEYSLWEGGLMGLLGRVCISLGYLLRATLWPFNIRVQLNYALSNLIQLPVSIVFLGVVGLCALVVLGWFVWRSIHRPALRPWLADVFTYVLLLLPTLNIAIIGSRGGTLSERYLYLPLIGCAALLGRALLFVPLRFIKIAIGASAILLIVNTLTLQREISWFTDDLSLFGHFAQQSSRELFTIDHLIHINLRETRFVDARRWAVRRLDLLTSPVELYTLAKGRVRSTPDQKVRAVAVASFLGVEALAVSDAEQERLSQLRDFVDALLASRRPAALIIGGKPIQIEGGAEALSALRNAGMLEQLRLLCIRLHARTLDLDGARQLASRLPAHDIGASSYTPIRAQLALWSGDVSAARAQLGALEAGERTPLLQGINALEQALESGSVSAYARAVAWSGLPARARLILKTESSIESDIAMIEIDLLDGRPDLAMRRIRNVQGDSRLTMLSAQARQMLDSGKGLRTVKAPF